MLERVGQSKCERGEIKERFMKEGEEACVGERGTE